VKLTLQAPIRLKASAGKPRRFKILAYTGGVLKVTGFALPVVVDLQGLEAGAVAIVLDHQVSTSTTVGQADQIENTGESLVLAGPVTGNSDQVQRVLAQADAGHQWQASIGAEVSEQQIVPAGELVKVNGQQFRGPLIVARKSRLVETSVLPVGADSNTSVNLAARAALKGHAMSFEQWVESMGIDLAKVKEPALAALMQAYDTEQSAEPAMAAAAVVDLRAARAVEHERIGRVEQLAVGHPQIAATAIRLGWTPEQTEMAVLKAGSRIGAPSDLRASGAPTTIDNQVLSASLMLRCGREGLALKAFGERTVDAARRSRITNLVDLASASLQAAGKDPGSYVNRDQMLRAAFTTQHLPTILSDTVGRTLVDAYEESTTDWKKFCYVASAEDFRTQTGVRPAAIPNLSEVGNGGTIRHGTIGEEATYSWSVRTHAEMLSITRNTIVNDDLGFVAQISPMLGQAAGRSLNDLIWSNILGGQNAGFFSSGNANLLSASSALAVGSLGVAVAAMRSQTDSQGFDLSIAPAALVVPPGLELTARNLLNSSLLVGDTTANTLLPSGNPVQGIVPNLIVESRLANARFTGYDADAWYLFGGPNTRAVTVGFLQSQQAPTIEMDDAPFDQLGSQMRVVFDFGVALSDPKGAYKATGA